MKHGGLTTILPCSDFRHAVEDVQDADLVQVVRSGRVVARPVSWWAKHGGKVMLMSESWKLLAPNMWLDTSRKK